MACDRADDNAADCNAQAIGLLIRDVPDFPKPGIVFKDITPLLANPDGLDMAVEAMSEPWADAGVEAVVGIEARGFILGPLVARALGAGFVPVRKAGKLPAHTVSQSYGLEYGLDTVEMHSDALEAGRRTLVIDDVLATGGTAAATARLIATSQARVVGFGFLLELGFLNGRTAIAEHRIDTVLTVQG